MSSNCCNEAAAGEANCNGCIATAAMSSNRCMKMQCIRNALQLLHYSAGMNCNKCNEAAAAETDCSGCTTNAETCCNGCIAIMHCNNWNVAAAAENNCNGCIANAAITAEIAMKLQLRKLTAMVVLQMQQLLRQLQ